MNCIWIFQFITFLITSFFVCFFSLCYYFIELEFCFFFFFLWLKLFYLFVNETGFIFSTSLTKRFKNKTFWIKKKINRNENCNLVCLLSEDKKSFIWYFTLVFLLLLLFASIKSKQKIRLCRVTSQNVRRNEMNWNGGNYKTIYQTKS